MKNIGIAIAAASFLAFTGVPSLAIGQQAATAFDAPTVQTERWTAERANAWYKQQPWLVGANYLPQTAINQLEMFQADTFDPATIDKELGWAKNIGMNVMRVYLHNLLWEDDPKGLLERMDAYLAIADKHGIKTMFVLFDSCWNPDPKLGKQHPPIPGVHNSGWVQSPGRARLEDKSQYHKLESYVVGVVGHFARDKRIVAWDVWNEPNNDGGGNYARHDAKKALVEPLLALAFTWARSAGPSQPLTSGLWIGNDWSTLDKLDNIERIQMTQSDVVSFHNYSWPEEFERMGRQLMGYGRPILVTEYMARGNGSTFDTVLPIGKKLNFAMINWGFVDGKSQTRFPWDSWKKPYTYDEPTVWFHDIFRSDGKPYRQAEVDLIKKLSAQPKVAVSK